MNFCPRVLKIDDLETVYHFSKDQFQNLNEIEKTLLEWKSSWRKEALEHYLRTGWCMGVYDEANQLMGYFLAQPLLFTEAYTQSLWVEAIYYKSLDVASYMLDLSYKYARDKHLQRVLYNQMSIFKEVTIPFKIASTQKNYYEVYTAKLQ